MPAVLRIVLLIPVAYIAACLAAGFVVMAAVYGLGESRYPIDALAITFALFVAAHAGAFAALPMAAAVILAELFNWRSLLGWSLFCGAIGWAAQLSAERLDVSFATANRLGFVAAGIVGGAVYWLLAGRSGGHAAAVTSAAGRRPARRASTEDGA